MRGLIGRLGGMWLVVAWLLAAPAVATAQEGESGWSIARFDVALEVKANGTLAVTETIDADFAVEKHGIYREIPVRYAVGMHLYDIRFRLESVEDGEGDNRTTDVSYVGNLVRLKIGDKDRTLTGRQRYVIRYEVSRAMLWEGNRAWTEDGAVLRWNATGTDWRVPIDAVTVDVTLPKDLTDDQLMALAWTGPFGARGTDYVKSRPDNRHVRFVATRAFGPGEGLTVELMMPAGAVERPTWGTQAWWWLSDNLTYLLIPLMGASALGLWWTRGRDEAGRGTIVVEYTPPDDLRPAEVGTLLDESADLKDLSASIIDLAVRGYLKIEEVPGDGWLGSKPDYRFVKRKGSSGLKAFEKTLFDQLFDGSGEVLLSELKTKFYPAVGSAQTQLYEGLAREQYFAGNPSTVRWVAFSLGVFALAAGLFLAAIVQATMIGRVFALPIALTGVVGLLILGLTARVMPRRTKKGRLAWERIRGLEEYIRRAEVENLNEADRQGVFERLLPYAITLNLADRWAKAFEGLYLQPPEWYAGPVDGTFSTGHFVGSLDRSVDAMNSVFPTMPRSQGGGSGGSGWSSGGFSGGGSSGGGFGGGGGGSW